MDFAVLFVHPLVIIISGLVCTFFMNELLYKIISVWDGRITKAIFLNGSAITLLGLTWAVIIWAAMHSVLLDKLDNIYWNAWSLLTGVQNLDLYI